MGLSNPINRFNAPRLVPIKITAWKHRNVKLFPIFFPTGYHIFKADLPTSFLEGLGRMLRKALLASNRHGKVKVIDILPDLDRLLVKANLVVSAKDGYFSPL